MGWLAAWLAFAIFIGTGVSGVGHPILYGFFVSTAAVGLLRLLYGFFGGILDALLGKRR